MSHDEKGPEKTGPENNTPLTDDAATRETANSAPDKAAADPAPPVTDASDPTPTPEASTTPEAPATTPAADHTPGLTRGEFGPVRKKVDSAETPQAPAPPEQTAAPEKDAPAGSDPKAPQSGFSPEGVAATFTPPPRPRRILRKICLALLALFILALAAGGYIAFEIHNFLNTTPEAPAKETVEAEVFRGDTFSKVAKRLEAAGVIRNALYFRLYAMWEGRTASIQAGVFEFPTNWTPPEVLHHLVFGQPVLYRLTVPEGLPWWEVAKIVEEGGFATADDFKAVIHDQEFLAKYGIPFSNAEGFLFPDTYFLRKPKVMDKESALGLAGRMVGTFQKKTAELFAGRDMTPEKLKTIIILASMVEKESALEAERPLVAGVYTNRLAQGMLMQCDPTIIYGLGEKFTGNIRRRDLEDDSNPYNTYRHAGLPPGPICSPGLASIAAAVNPAKNDYLYFVATKPGGEHIFSTNLKDHNAAVNKYQR